MEYRHLGKSGIQVSALGLGTNNFGGRTDEETSVRVLLHALDLGINFIDTANTYSKGESEEIIGRALGERRHDIVLATKGGIPWGTGPNESGASRKHILDALEASLRRLRTDYVDLYYIHRPDPRTPIEETLDTLDDLVHQGKIRYIGCSNYQAWQACEAVHTSRTRHLSSFVCAQNEYNMISRTVERELVPFCKAYGVGLVPFYPLAAGFLTGKYRPGEPLPTGARYDDASKTRPAQAAMARGLQQRFLNDRNFGVLPPLEEYAGQAGHTLGELALAWLASNSAVSSVLVGASNTDQLEANIKGVEWQLAPEESAAVNQILDDALGPGI